MSATAAGNRRPSIVAHRSKAIVSVCLFAVFFPPRAALGADPEPPRAGYHVERNVDGTAVALSLLTLVPFYALGVYVAAHDHFENQKGWLVVPIAGPWMTLATRDPQCGRERSDGTCSFAPFVLVFDGAFQALGAVVLAQGLIGKKTWAPNTTWTVVPYARPSSAGLSVGGEW
jgi:hypothetical protein